MKEIHILLKDPSRTDEAVEVLKQAGIAKPILNKAIMFEVGAKRDVVVACFWVGNHEPAEVLAKFLKPLKN